MAKFSSTMNSITSSNKDLGCLEGTTLIIPSVSLANVPQLTVDLLIHNYNFVRIGRLNDRYLYPFASPIDHGEHTDFQHGISTGLELYYSEEHNLSLIQQRSPIIPTFTKPFVIEVIEPFLSHYKIQKLVVLDSEDSGLNENVIPNFVETYTNADLLSNSMESLRLSDDVKSLVDVEYKHSKYVKCLIDAINKSNGKIDVTVIVMYVYEGENFIDATNLTERVVKKLELPHYNSMKCPVSWKGVYGDKPIPDSMEEGIYG